MGVNWYVDSALGVLRNQLRAKYPGIVIGTIGDASHQTVSPSSDHNPEADGSVDALDLMLGPHFTRAQANAVVNSLILSRDWRIKYIIWERRIMAGKGGPSPWVWRPYGGSDPHTGHPHISRNDVDENNKSLWRISMDQKDYPKWTPLDDYSLPVLSQGMNDNDFKGYNNIARLQDLLNIPSDSDYGPQTAAAVRKRVGHGDGKTVGAAEWAIVLGFSKR